MLPAFAASLPLLILACAMIGMHLRGWRAAKESVRDAQERDYLYRQFRRRMQVSSMLGVLAVGMFIGLLIPIRQYPSLYVFVWFGILLFVIWILMLALGDLAISRQRVARLRQHQRIAQQQLAAEVQRIRRQAESEANQSKG